MSTSAPEPMILSGGILPACWRLGINAFDIKPLEIGITVFLPDLWYGKGAQLRVEVFNGQGFQPLKIGDIWMVAASVLRCESSNIESSFGRFKSVNSSLILDHLGYLQILITYMRLCWLTKLLKSGVMLLLLYLTGRNSL
jgi:hypothetical protein